VLWPDAAPTQAAFNETVSRARRMLGLDPEGVHHLLPVDNRRYRVGRHVVTDASVLEEHALDGCARDALRLVRGLPFEATDRGYEWSYEEGQAHRFAALIDEARNRMERDGPRNAEPTDSSVASVRTASSSRSA
jgi:hypothetical protein